VDERRMVTMMTLAGSAATAAMNIEDAQDCMK